MLWLQHSYEKAEKTLKAILARLTKVKLRTLLSQTRPRFFPLFLCAFILHEERAKEHEKEKNKKKIKRKWEGNKISQGKP